MNARPVPTSAMRFAARLILALAVTAGAAPLAQTPAAPPTPSLAPTNLHPKFIAPGVLELGLVRRESLQAIVEPHAVAYGHSDPAEFSRVLIGETAQA